MSTHSAYNQLNFHFIRFDDYIQGKHVKVTYTHHEPPTGRKIGRPLFLPFDKNNRPLTFYVAGFAEAIDWIKEVDSKIESGIIK